MTKRHWSEEVRLRGEKSRWCRKRSFCSLLCIFKSSLTKFHPVSQGRPTSEKECLTTVEHHHHVPSCLGQWTRKSASSVSSLSNPHWSRSSRTSDNRIASASAARLQLRGSWTEIVGLRSEISARLDPSNVCQIRPSSLGFSEL